MHISRKNIEKNQRQEQGHWFFKSKIIIFCRISLRASVSIQKDDELFVSYTNLLWPTLYRREHLLEGKYFECDCPRCTDPTELESYTSTLKCKKCDLGFINSTNPLGD